jgi:hypothetical protein
MCLTAFWYGFHSFIFNCILRNCKRLSHKAFQSNGPTRSKDSGRENTLTFWEPHKNPTHSIQYLQKIALLTQLFYLNRAANGNYDACHILILKVQKHWWFLFRLWRIHFLSNVLILWPSSFQTFNWRKRYVRYSSCSICKGVEMYHVFLYSAPVIIFIRLETCVLCCMSLARV